MNQVAFISSLIYHNAAVFFLLTADSASKAAHENKEHWVKYNFNGLVSINSRENTKILHTNDWSMMQTHKRISRKKKSKNVFLPLESCWLLFHIIYAHRRVDLNWKDSFARIGCVTGTCMFTKKELETLSGEVSSKNISCCAPTKLSNQLNKEPKNLSWTNFHRVSFCALRNLPPEIRILLNREHLWLLPLSLFIHANVYASFFHRRHHVSTLNHQDAFLFKFIQLQNKKRINAFNFSISSPRTIWGSFSFTPIRIRERHWPHVYKTQLDSEERSVLSIPLKIQFCVAE